MKHALALFALPLLLLVSGCASLDPTGPYNGDQTLYNADNTIAASYDTVHRFVVWELDNRAALRGTPQLKELADNLRLNYPTWHRAAMSARNVYANAKTSANASALAMSLDVLRDAARQANQWFANAPASVASPLGGITP